jgi:hypothetical protein
VPGAGYIPDDYIGTGNRIVKSSETVKMYGFKCENWTCVRKVQWGRCVGQCAGYQVPDIFL